MNCCLNWIAKGYAHRAGSACSTGAKDPSHVLLAIGLSMDMANGALRVTIGEKNTKEEVEYLIQNLVEIVEKLRTLY